MERCDECHCGICGICGIRGEIYDSDICVKCHSEKGERQDAESHKLRCLVSFVLALVLSGSFYFAYWYPIAYFLGVLSTVVVMGCAVFLLWRNK